MTENEIRHAIATTPKGANVWVVWERPCYLRAGFSTMPLTKRTRMLCRLGINYDEKEQTKLGRANGTLPAQNAGMRGKEWDTFPFIVRYIKTGKLGLRLESGTFPNAKTSKKYLLDGQEVNIEDYRQFCTAKEFPPERDGQLTFDVRIEAIESIHQYHPVQEAEVEMN